MVSSVCRTTSTQPTRQPMRHWQSWMPLSGIFSCVHPGMTISSAIRERGCWMPSTNRHLPSAPLSCLQASLCTTGQMLNKDHDTTTADTQLICIALANYGNICKKPFTAEGWHIMQCYSKFRGYSFAWSVLSCIEGCVFVDFEQKNCSCCLNLGLGMLARAENMPMKNLI